MADDGASDSGNETDVAQAMPDLPAGLPNAPLPTPNKDESPLDDYQQDWIRRSFADYAAESSKNRAWMNTEYIAAIELMHILSTLHAINCKHDDSTSILPRNKTKRSDPKPQAVISHSW